MRSRIVPGTLNFVLLVAALISFFITADAQSKKDIKKANQLVEQAHQAFQQKNYRVAADTYGQATALVPKHPEAHFWKGYAHSYLKEYDVALTELEMALSQGFKPQDVYKIRWSIYFQTKNLEAALADVKKGLELEPNNLMFLSAVGDISYANENYAEAVNAYQKALAINQSNPDYYYYIAISQAKLGDIKAQGVAAEAAVKGRTRFLGESYYLLADSYYRQRRFPEAAEAYLATINAKPDIIEAYRNLADIYRGDNRFTDAIDISKRGLRAFPNDGNIYTDLSWYYSLADRHQEAIQAAQAGMKLLPSQSMAYTNLCRAYNDTKQYQLAIKACTDALKIAPKDGETHYYLGWAHDRLGKGDEAARHFKLAVDGLIQFTKDNPGYSDGFYLLGNAYYADHQRDKAIEAWNKCLELSPRFVKARYNLGYTYVLKKDKAAAMDQYNSLLSLDPILATKLKGEIDKL